MLLSEAIKVGAQKRPQNFGKFYGNGRTCVIGAAAEGLTGEPPARTNKEYGYHELLKSHFPALMAKQVLCPTDCGAGRITVWHALYHLNDTHRWARERIADWVSKFETEG